MPAMSCAFNRSTQHRQKIDQLVFHSLASFKVFRSVVLPLDPALPASEQTGPCPLEKTVSVAGWYSRWVPSAMGSLDHRSTLEYPWLR